MEHNLKGLINKSKYFIGKYSPEILTGLGITGMITSTILAVKATPKALTLIENKKKENGQSIEEPLLLMDVVKTTWKVYIPSFTTGVISIACIISASRKNYKRNAALATAYSLSERTLSHYREKVIELCMDAMSGRYFKSDMETIKQVVNKLNRRIAYENYISLNDFYNEIGLSDVKNGELLGWNIDSGLIEPTFSTCLSEDGRPCIVIDFDIEPKYGFDKMS